MEFIDYINRKQEVINYINDKYKHLQLKHNKVYVHLFHTIYMDFLDNVQYKFINHLAYPSTELDYIVYNKDLEIRDKSLIQQYKNKDYLYKIIQLIINKENINNDMKNF